jgi:hypothetical protein
LRSLVTKGQSCNQFSSEILHGLPRSFRTQASLQLVGRSFLAHDL